ncbi:MAG: hypothetical protein HKN25_15440 [Pyrinomonadaceae bacterium]|nr:hypothetical protein [Pyrinomonadaceae bacterium]
MIFRPEILLLPILMIADYYLTILGAILREKKYGEYFPIETYEMNPTYQDDIDSKRLFNPRFIGQLILNFGLLFLASLFLTDALEFLYWIILGFYLTLFAYINGLHMSNILSFLFVKSNPNVMKSEIRISHRYNLYSSLFTNSVLLLPVIFILLFSYSHFILGSLIAVLYNAFLCLMWIAKNRKSSKSET